MRRFHLRRLADVSGVSGTGYVAEGVEFTDGLCVLRWLVVGTATQATPATGFYASLADVEAIHGHAGATVIEWIDEGLMARMAQFIRRNGTPRPGESLVVVLSDSEVGKPVIDGP